LKTIAARKALVNVLGVSYIHTKTSDGGDIYLTRFAERHQKRLELENWYEKSWFEKKRTRLLGTSFVYRVPTKEVEGKSIDLVVKNCRVGEDVPVNTRTLKEFCDAEFNSPWEEFSLVMEMREGQYGPKNLKIRTQHPLAIYVPPEKMQHWQSGRSRSRINRIRARHPGIDLDILKQYKLVYEWIRGKNLSEIFEQIDIPTGDIVAHLQKLTGNVMEDMNRKGYLMADMKPEHVILDEPDVNRIEEMGVIGSGGIAEGQVESVYKLMDEGRHSVIDYELLFLTPDHEDHVKSTRRHSYLDDQRHRLEPTSCPVHLSCEEIMGVPYIHGHAESTGGHLWVVGRNSRLFDYFLPERWRKTPSLSLSSTNEVFYTVTKDNIHLVWKTSRVGEFLDNLDNAGEIAKISRHGINSPFEEFAVADELNRLGIHAVYPRAIYRTGGMKIEKSNDLRKYESHKDILDSEGKPILMESHNYITIRGYYNGPDEWVPEHEDALYRPIDLPKALTQGIIDDSQLQSLHQRVVERLREAGYDGTMLKSNDLLLAVDHKGEIMKNSSGELDVIICNFEFIWKMVDSG
jgi:hypothetical protein